MKTFRQSKQLAEGQKSTPLKHILTPPPPSAKSKRGYFLEKKDVSIYKPSNCKNGTPPMAEGVEFLEKNHNFGQKPRPLAEEVRKNSEQYCEMLSMNPARLPATRNRGLAGRNALGGQDLNGTNMLKLGTTVKDPGTFDTLTGGAPALPGYLDWFFKGIHDTIINQEGGEQVN